MLKSLKAIMPGRAGEEIADKASTASNDNVASVEVMENEKCCNDEPHNNVVRLVRVFKHRFEKAAKKNIRFEATQKELRDKLNRLQADLLKTKEENAALLITNETLQAEKLKLQNQLELMKSLITVESTNSSIHRGRGGIRNARGRGQYTRGHYKKSQREDNLLIKLDKLSYVMTALVPNSLAAGQQQYCGSQQTHRNNVLVSRSNDDVHQPQLALPAPYYHNYN